VGPRVTICVRMRGSQTKRARHAMVASQIAARGVADRRVLDAMREVPREAFVSPALAARAYDDTPLAIDAGQTISQPYIVALMVEACRVTPQSRVLEIGAGSGYAAAVLSRIAREVYAVERHEVLADTARAHLGDLGYDNVHVSCADGTLGCPERAPFDAILVSAGGPVVPKSLRDQLAIGGRLVMPIGASPHAQTLRRVVRTGPHTFAGESLAAVHFVPLIGAEGFAEDIDVARR
jgi:protein-L-isoaspartate(D-aspartate) O-methyltransferase